MLSGGPLHLWPFFGTYNFRAHELLAFPFFLRRARVVSVAGHRLPCVWEDEFGGLRW